jgi:replicative DNA helicase
LDDSTSFRTTRDFVLGEGVYKDTRRGAWWVVDYIQMHPAEGSDAYDSATRLSKQFTQLAKRGVPGLVVAQMNRNVEATARKDKRPLLSDLRGSGQLEQDGSGPVMGLYRPDLYGEEVDGDKHRPKPAELVVLKQRNGPIGTVELMWCPAIPAYVDVSEYVDELPGGGANAA